MNVLTVFYSRTGTTRKVAESISKAFSCEIEEILDTKNRRGALGYIASGRDASQKRLTVIHPAKKDPRLYDMVLIGTPVWAGTISTPVRTYISQNNEYFRKVAFFCTCSGAGADKTFDAMKDLCKKDPVASIAIRTKETKSEEYLQRIEEFLSTVKKTSEL